LRLYLFVSCFANESDVATQWVIDKKGILADRVTRVDFDGNTTLDWLNLGQYYHHKSDDGQHFRVYFCGAVNSCSCSILLINTATEAGSYLAIVSNSVHK
jgi:hypothetical protein